MIIASNGADLDFLVAGCVEGMVLDAQLLYSCAINLAQQTHNAGFLPCAAGSVNQ